MISNEQYSLDQISKQLQGQFKKVGSQIVKYTIGDQSLYVLNADKLYYVVSIGLNNQTFTTEIDQLMYDQFPDDKFIGQLIVHLFSKLNRNHPSDFIRLTDDEVKLLSELA